MTASKSPRAIALAGLRQLTAHKPLDPKGSIIAIFHADVADPDAHAYQDRASALVAATTVEIALEDALLARFVPLTPDERRFLFSEDADSPLSTFAAKIRLGYALHIYEKGFRDDLTVLKAIRNAFAHASHHVDFNTPEISSACQIMNTAQCFARLAPSQSTPKWLYLQTTKAITLALFMATKNPDDYVKDDGFFVTVEDNIDVYTATTSPSASS